MRRFIPAPLILAVLSAACAGERPQVTVTTRLVDLFPQAQVTGAEAEAAVARPRTEWKFADAAAPGAAGDEPWKAHSGVAGLALADGKLAGRSTTALPILHVRREADPADTDPLYAVEVRARVGAGANLTLVVAGEKEPSFEDLAGQFELLSWGRTPITPGDQAVTYTLTSPISVPGSRISHVYLRPTDAAGADFAIESVRLVFRSEHLASIDSGVSWQGLGEIYRETLVARTPETIRFDSVAIPDDAWLDLALGTIEGQPVTFRVSLESEGKRVPLVERTVTTPDLWQPVVVDLAKWSGSAATVELSIDSAEKGTVGLWGSPAIRRRGMAPATAALPRLAEREPEPPLGVILIMMDTLRADHLDAWGYHRETAPTLTKMAERGVRFADNLSQGTWTKVAAPSLMTSLYPSAHTVHSFYDRLPAQAHTLAESFRSAGYATLSLSSVLFTGKFSNLHQGFEELHESTSMPDLPSKDGVKSTRTYVDRLLPWLERHRADPFFVYLHTTDPHDPFEPREPFASMWTEADAGRELLADQAKAAKVITHPLMRLFMMPNRAELEAAGVDPMKYVEREIGWYDGSIRGFDVELQRLLERLRELDLEQRTLIAFVADHGEEFLEHGSHFHGHSVYGELTHVPMLLYWPGTLPEGLTVEPTVETIDLMPTLLELAGIAPPQGLQGQSLVPLLASGGDEGAASRTGWKRRPAVAEKADVSEGTGGNPANEALEAYAIVDDGWRLIHNIKNRGERPEFELFDHAKDPVNLTNVAAEHPDIVERMAKELAAWKRATLEGKLEAGAEADAGLSSEEMERLRALGYL